MNTNCAFIFEKSFVCLWIFQFSCGELFEGNCEVKNFLLSLQFELFEEPVENALLKQFKREFRVSFSSHFKFSQRTLDIFQKTLAKEMSIVIITFHIPKTVSLNVNFPKMCR